MDDLITICNIVDFIFDTFIPKNGFYITFKRLMNDNAYVLIILIEWLKFQK